MPPKYKKKDCLIILVNIGCTDENPEYENEKSFLENSKHIMKLLIQRRIFLRPKDEIGIILMGSSDTKNGLNYENIVEMNSLQIPTWNLIESINNLKGTNEKSANWVEGMNVVLEYINTECVDVNTSVTVVLLTDFKEDSDVMEQYDIDTVANDIKARNINLLSIGKKSLNENIKININSSEEAFLKVCKIVEGQIMTFDETIPKLMIYKNQVKTPMPWKIDMDLFDIQIPIIMYLKTTEDFKLPKWQLFTNNETNKIPIEREYTFVDKKKQIISQDDIITGNMYGRKFIPFSDEDKAALKYESGPKGFTIYGFTKQQFISMDCLSGKGSYIVVPAQQWARPFYSLVKAMADQKKVAIVRRVFRANVAPKMGVLFPKINLQGQPWCLVYIELIFAEDRRIVQVKPIKSTMRSLSDEQVNVVNDLIDSMMLMEVEDDLTHDKKEAFEAGVIPDVSKQNIWDRITHRALNPDTPLPSMSNFLKKFLQPSHSVQKKSEPILESIKLLFPVKTLRQEIEEMILNEKINKSSKLNKDSVNITENVDTTRVQTNFEKYTQDEDIDDEELSRIADSIEAASQDMDIDLDELAKNM